MLASVADRRHTVSHHPVPTAERPVSREEIIDQLEQLERQVNRLSPGAQGPKGNRGWKGLAAPVYSPTIVDLEEHKRSVEREWAPFNTELRRFRTTLRRLHNLHQSIETNDTRKLLVGFIHLLIICARALWRSRRTECSMCATK